MKIAFSGFHGCGKTTSSLELCAWIKRESRTCNLVSGAARSSRRLLAGDFSIDMHLEVIGMQVVQEVQSSQYSDFVVCDRSMLDYLAYGKSRGLEIGPSSEIFLGLKEFMRPFTRTYDAIFVIDGVYDDRDGDELRSAKDVDYCAFHRSLNEVITEFGLEDTVHRVKIDSALQFAKRIIQQSL